MRNFAQNKMGIIERIIRIGIGYGLIVISMSASRAGSISLLLPLLSMYPILTGVFGWDPIIKVLGKRIKAVIR